MVKVPHDYRREQADSRPVCAPRPGRRRPARVRAMEPSRRDKLRTGLPRLLLAWVCTEAVRTQSRELILGDSLSEFMRKVGIYSTSGDKHTRLRNQIRRLFGCTVSLLYEDARGEATLNAPIARLTEFWWSERQPDARSLWESRIELGEDFFNEIIRYPIPIEDATCGATVGRVSSPTGRRTKAAPGAVQRLTCGLAWRTSTGRLGFPQNPVILGSFARPNTLTENG